MSASGLLGIYHRLPSPLRSLAASLWGLYLRSWRYGPETERLIEEAAEREYWTAERWKTWREERLAYTLRRAATRVPYYRQHWAERRRRRDRASLECLENWPILEKESVRREARAFVADDCDVRRMFRQHTSGTSGKPVELWRTRQTMQAWYALNELRCRLWYGVSRKDRWGILGGRLVTAVDESRPPFWVYSAALKQLYLSSYHLAIGLVPSYLDALRRYGVKYVVGYTSSLNALAQGALRLGRHDLGMRVAVTSAESLLAFQRRAIAEAFQCPVRETYSMAEIAAAASECEAGRLHLWPEVGWVECLGEDSRPVYGGEAGDLVCTGLLNEDMPLIRYRVGDRGRLAGGEAACACGRSLPVLASLEGRTDTVFYTADGRQVGCVDTMFDSGMPIHEAQIVQEALDRVRILYVPAPAFSVRWADTMIENLRARMGRVSVILEEVEQVPRGANGKFQAIICRLSPEERGRSLSALR